MKRKLTQSEEISDNLTEQVFDDSSCIRCSFAPCSGQVFSSMERYEAHYYSIHSYICQQCGKNFPSDRFLDLHIDEWHNPFTEISRDRGEKVYKCFESGCEKVCSSPQKRRLHLIDKHGYPRNFLFSVIERGMGDSLLKSG